ncbi:MAG: type II toxin-antitoxin system prevent-host-death family antitoxin [Xanthobacteraceae bacterium]|nr:type II toxin-antitoxin system prevent-host-death family antitoxin [Xanthobacteraceae bacterium]
MRIPLTKAEGRLAELIRRAEEGEEVILTREGQAVARLTAVQVRTIVDPPARQALLEAVRRSGAAKATPGSSAARSQDFLYDADGMPSET